MCKRCSAVDESGKALSPTTTLECSWCDDIYNVCWYAAGLINSRGKAGLCDVHYSVLMGVRRGDFGRINSRRSDQEYDVDANGWLSNSIRLLEDPVERPIQD